MIGRRVRGIPFPHPLEVRRVPDGEMSRAAASKPFRRRGREVVLLRLGGPDTPTYALALNSEAPDWRWPTSGNVVVVMLYRARGDRRVHPELRRLTDVQRRDALFKAELTLPA